MNSAGEPQWLQESVPRETELTFEPYCFATTARRSLPIPTGVKSAPTLEVLHRRRSRRTFGTLGDEQLSSLLWFAAKTLAIAREPSGFSWQHRPAPSGGGRHPIYILVLEPAIDPSPVLLYEPEGHALLTLDIKSEAAPNQFLNSLQSVLPPQQGTVLWFAADHLRTASRYQHGESLVWRDAGALLTTIGIAAEALNLHCCGFGLAGNEWVSRLLPSPRFVGVGGCVVGSPPLSGRLDDSTSREQLAL